MVSLLIRPEAQEGESIYGFIHRVAFYNGFKRLPHFISHIMGEKCYYIQPKQLMASRELRKALATSTRLSNAENLKLNVKALSRAPAYGFTYSPRVCPSCFSETPILKHQWLFQDERMCHEHGMPLSELEWVKLNTQEVINWEELREFCQEKADQDKGSALENIAHFHKTSESSVWILLESYFDQRHKEVCAYAMLDLDQRKKLPRIENVSTKEQFQKILDILSEPKYMSKGRAYELTYWGVVDPLLQIDRLGLANGYFRYSNESIDYCKFDFINDFPPSATSKLFCDIKHPKTFNQLKIFSPALSLPWLSLLDEQEVQELTSLTPIKSIIL